MTKGLLDKISLSLIIILTLTIGYTLFEWTNNAFQKHKHWVYSVDVNEEGTVASASEDQILLWDGRYCIDSLVGHNDWIKSISYSKDGKFITSGSGDKTVKVWSSADNKIIQTLHGHTAGVNNVEFNAFGNYIISAGYDDKLFIWDWRNQERLKEFDVKHTGFSVNKADILAFVDTTCNLTLFDLNSLSLIKIVGQYCGMPIFHPDGKILGIRTENGNIQFIDSTSGELKSELDIKHGTHYGPYVFTPEGSYIVVGIWGGDIEIWDWQQKKLVKTLNGTFATSTNEFAFNNENQLLSASGDQSVKTWDIKTGRLKSNVGDGLYRKQLNGVIAILCLVTLVSGFLGMYQSNENKYSYWAVMSILTVWSLGILALGLFFKSFLARYSTAIIWVLTVISGLAVLSLYGAMLAVYIIPISLFLGYVKLRTDYKDKRIVIPIFLNLIMCGVLTSFIVSAGLWR
jgi:WD40 repeat protein